MDPVLKLLFAVSSILKPLHPHLEELHEEAEKLVSRKGIKSEPVQESDDQGAGG